MAVATWREEYNVDVAKIDEQHKQLLDRVSRLHKAVEDRIDKNDLKQMLIDLAEFTATHFATEEKLMQQHNYPAYKTHLREHKMLLRHLHDLVTAVSNGKYPTFYSDYDVSNDWALLHIHEHDKPLGAFLNRAKVF
ncbi:MAG: hemerythrin family protein [Gammaproteobacteria bacterium]|nr:hemerythrin family protein [Gammaproteobacteria bacterium]